MKRRNVEQLHDNARKKDSIWIKKHTHAQKRAFKHSPVSLTLAVQRRPTPLRLPQRKAGGVERRLDPGTIRSATSFFSERALSDQSEGKSVITVTVGAGGSGPAAGADAGEARRVFHTGGSVRTRGRQTRMFH